MLRATQAPGVMEHSTRRPAGYVEVTSPDFPTPQGGETLMCVHCQMHWVVEPGSGRRRGWCWKCNGPTCGKYNCEMGCMPFEKALEMSEARDRLRRKVAISSEFNSKV